MNTKEIIAYIESVSLILVSSVLLLLPLFFLINTTDFFFLPKQLLVTGVTLLLMLLWGAKTLIEGRISFRSSPFNFPLFLFGAVALSSALLSVNFYNSLLQTVPLLGILFFSFIVINTINTRSAFNIALSALAIGAVISSLISILYYARIYILPFPVLQSPDFTTIGSPLQHIAYLIPVLILSSFFVIRRAKEENLMQLVTKDYGVAIHLASSVLILAGIALTVYKIATTPIQLLPFNHGFQIAINSLSDPARTLQAFLVGSGYGTFLTSFTRFKNVTFNNLPDLWNQPFAFSSSYFLEIIPTMGLLGAGAFLFLVVRLIKSRAKDFNPLFIALLIAFALAFVVPYSFTLVALLFILLAFYVTYLYLDGSRKVFDSSLSLVSFKKGLFSVDEDESNRRKTSPMLTVLLAMVIIIPVAFVGFYLVQFTRSDLMFAKSIQQINQGSAEEVYNLQFNAISTFPYKADYYRIFSQLNLELANVAVSNLPQGQEPSQDAQNQILVLLQQSINASRRAVALAPLNTNNWQNLARIYRSLIGVGQNAEQFAVASVNQAIALNPTDPRPWIELGGIYYQFGEYETAQTHFQQAVRLKNDYANAHYNLGHALEEKGDLALALQEYQIVRALVQDNEQSLALINQEIEALQARIGDQAGEPEDVPEPGSEQDPIDLNQAPQFPERDPRADIPGPPSPAVKASPTPTPDEDVTPTPEEE